MAAHQDCTMPTHHNTYTGNNHAADGPPGVLGVAAAVAAFVAAAVWALGRQRQRVVTTDRTTLATLVRKPMHFTEHALCRMDCRYMLWVSSHVGETQQ